MMTYDWHTTELKRMRKQASKIANQKLYHKDKTPQKKLF